jgi:hypothetical protein
MILVRYDMLGPEDLLVSLTSRCESAVNIMRSRLCSPVGLDLASYNPKSIGLGIAATLPDPVSS